VVRFLSRVESGPIFGRRGKIPKQKDIGLGDRIYDASRNTGHAIAPRCFQLQLHIRIIQLQSQVGWSLWLLSRA